ncbi:hypothetical protein DJICPGNB_02650 [Escherichia coli]|nr:hypothetical protein DJICPGNB_02650 [Escherichia coli]
MVSKVPDLPHILLKILYKLPPEANLMGFAHYLEALDFQREIVKIHAVFGGKSPHPNWIVGGMPCAINIDESSNGAVDTRTPKPVQQLSPHGDWRMRSR